ncbi:hypothetical protein C8R47DRAFT_1147534 [Mycena vitilis]|nr:hypothetical protein C8R47DRAFT_1147534 [Mycena vitilis]
MQRLQTVLSLSTKRPIHRSVLYRPRTSFYTSTVRRSPASNAPNMRAALAEAQKTAHNEFTKNCQEIAAPLSASFSCDWKNWDCLDFFEVPPTWTNMTEAEFVLNVLHKLPKPIIPLAFLPGNDEAHFAFEGGGNYYYYYGSNGEVWHYLPDQFSSREDFVRRLITDGKYVAKETPHNDAVMEKTDDEQRAAARAL